MIRGVLCNTNARTNEEYKKTIKSRMILLGIMGFLGAFTMIVAFLAEFKWDVSISDRMLGVYTGFGTGLLIVSILFIFQNIRLLGNEEKLKENRIKNADERIQEISNRAFRYAGGTLFFATYVVSLIGGLFYPELVQVLFILVAVFVITYFGSYFYLNKKL